MKWLLLRGLGREERHWSDFTPLLNRATDGVLCLDLPGVGSEVNESAPLTIRGNTEHIRKRFLGPRQNHEDWGILGLSFGGMIALDWVYRYPYDFKKVVVVNTSSKDTGPFWQRLTLYGIYQMGKIASARDSLSRERAIMKMVSNMHAKNEELIQEFAEIRDSAPVANKTFMRQLIAATQFMLPPKIKIPALLLASLKDNMVDVRCSKLMAERLNAQIKFHPTAGHDLPLDDPHWCVERVCEFDNERMLDADKALPSRGPQANTH